MPDNSNFGGSAPTFNNECPAAISIFPKKADWTNKRHYENRGVPTTGYVSPKYFQPPESCSSIRWLNKPKKPISHRRSGKIHEKVDLGF